MWPMTFTANANSWNRIGVSVSNGRSTRQTDSGASTTRWNRRIVLWLERSSRHGTRSYARSNSWRETSIVTAGTQPQRLTADEIRQIQRLAEDLPVLWRAAHTTDEDRKVILRQLIDRIVVDVEGEWERVELYAVNLLCG